MDQKVCRPIYLDIIILLKGQTIAYKKDKTHINLLIETPNSFVKQTVTKI